MSDRLKARVRVWPMPDSQSDGTLESLLHMLIDETDPLIGQAESATVEARRLGATFSDGKRGSAIIHAWLAWQADPGLPYGSAIRARCFDVDKPAGQAFAAWFKKLYEIE